MKKHNQCLLMMAVVLLSLVGCQQTLYFSNSKSGNVAVKFASNVETRMVDNTWQTGDYIGVFMTSTGCALSDDAVIDDAANKKYIYNSDDTFAAATRVDTLYYPKSGNVDFIAYYPYTTVEDYSVAIDVADQSDASAIDFLYSNNLTNVAASEETVTLTFTHQLSKIVFNISAGTGYSAADLEGLTVTLLNIASTGSCALATGEVTVNENTTDIETVASSDGTSAEAIVLPQTLTDKQVKVTLASKLNFLFNFTNTTWSSSNAYAYNITINKDDYNTGSISATITDWTTNNAEDMSQSGSSWVDEWDGTTSDASWYTASETSFTIATPAQLAGLASLVNDGNSFEECTITLADNLNMGNAAWHAIGATEDKSFKGTFDGNGYTISRLLPTVAVGDSIAALFGYNSGVIANLTVDGYVAYEDAITDHNLYLAGVAAINANTISGCTANVDVIATVTSSTAVNYLGGVVAKSSGTVSDCSNKGYIESDGYRTYVGGIVGYAKSETAIAISGCSNVGKVVVVDGGRQCNAAGVAGYACANTTISNSTNDGTVTCTVGVGSTNAVAGGIAAVLLGTITGCTNNGAIIASNTALSTNCYAGGIVGGLSGGTVHTSTHSSTATAEANYAAGVAAYAYGTSPYVYSCCKSEGTPSTLIARDSDTSAYTTCTEHNE